MIAVFSVTHFHVIDLPKDIICRTPPPQDLTYLQLASSNAHGIKDTPEQAASAGSWSERSLESSPPISDDNQEHRTKRRRISRDDICLTAGHNGQAPSIHRSNTSNRTSSSASGELTPEYRQKNHRLDLKSRDFFHDGRLSVDSLLATKKDTQVRVPLIDLTVDDQEEASTPSDLQEHFHPGTLFVGFDRGDHDQDTVGSSVQPLNTYSISEIMSTASSEDSSTQIIKNDFGIGGYYDSSKPIPIPSAPTPLPGLLKTHMDYLYLHFFVDYTARLLVPHGCSRNEFQTLLPASKSVVQFGCNLVD